MVMRFFSTLLLVACIAGAMGCASLITPKPGAERAALRDGAYRLDPDHASVLFKIDHLGYSNYVGRFNRLNAVLDFSTDDPQASTLEAIVEIDSLDVANDAFSRTLLGPSWFDGTRFPQAIFRSTSVEITGDQNGRITGDLTLRGVTAPMMLEVTFNGGAQDLLRGGYVLGFSAVGVLDRTQFGVDALSGVIASEVRLEIEAEFIRR